MPDVAKVNQQKERILLQIRTRGPSLPVQIARGIEVDGLFAGAFLSELFRERKIRMSNMKVGSSPLYYIEGQENLLGNFIEHLNIREREAFSLLQKEKILDDGTLTPVMRVALRAIKDFAIPVRIRADGDVKLFWRYFLLDDSDFMSLMQEKIDGKKIVEKKKEVEGVDMEDKEKKKGKMIGEVSVSSERTMKVDEFVEVEKKVEKKKEKENEFGRKIVDYLGGKDLEILEVYSDKKREFLARIRADMLFGKQEFYLVAKDKKSITDNDLIVALQQAQGAKMPALVLSSGELSKKGREHLGEWGGLIKWEKVRF
jgi:hypothetical protein